MNASSYTLLVALIGCVLLLFVARQTMRRWSRSLIAEADRKLHLPIPTFQYTNRREIINRLLDDEELQRRIDEQVEATGCSAETLHKRCRRYADEIVPAFNAVFYFRIGRWLARSLLQSLYRVHVRMLDDAAVDAIEPGSSVVLVMNHRSNMDVLLISYLTSRRSTLINTAGEWARMWPLYHLVHMAGHCITDRDTQDVLYKHLFRAFIQMAVRERCNMAIFPEGELPRDGELQRPKFGLFSYVVSADPQHAESLYLIPVGINYDRTPEEEQLVAKPEAVYRRQGKLRVLASVIRATVVFTARFVLPRRAQFGSACASFGRPISLRDWQSGRGNEASESGGRHEWVSALGNEVFEQASRLIPVLPSHALAALLVSEKRNVWSQEEIYEEGMRLLNEFRDQGGVTCFPDVDERRVFAVTVEDFSRRKLVSIDTEGQLTANPEQMPLLRYLANSVSHLLVSP